MGLHIQSYHLDTFLQMHLLKWSWNSGEHRTEPQAGEITC